MRRLAVMAGIAFATHPMVGVVAVQAQAPIPPRPPGSTNVVFIQKNGQTYKRVITRFWVWNNFNHQWVPQTSVRDFPYGPPPRPPQPAPPVRPVTPVIPPRPPNTTTAILIQKGGQPYKRVITTYYVWNNPSHQWVPQRTFNDFPLPRNPSIPPPGPFPPLYPNPAPPPLYPNSAPPPPYPNPAPPVDPNGGGSVDPNGGGSVDPNGGGSIDPNGGSGGDPNGGGSVDPNGGGGNPNGGGDPNGGVDPNGGGVGPNMSLSGAAVAPPSRMLGVKAKLLDGNAVASIDSRFQGGLSIIEIQPGERAASAGLAVGDILVQLGNTRVLSTDNVQTALDPSLYPATTPSIPCFFLRGGQLMTGAVTLSP